MYVYALQRDCVGGVHCYSARHANIVVLQLKWYSSWSASCRGLMSGMRYPYGHWHTSMSCILGNVCSCTATQVHIVTQLQTAKMSMLVWYISTDHTSCVDSLLLR
jgi:hypothetical protein